MTDGLDPRLNAFRADLADRRLRDRVSAPTYRDGEPAVVVAALADLRRRPSPDAPLDTQALRGETVRVFDRDEEGWAWVQLDRDGYVGYAPTHALGETGGSGSSHRIVVPRTLLFPGPDIKQPPIGDLPLDARVSAREIRRDSNATYAMIDPAGAVVLQHLAPVDERGGDYVAVAERFREAPYLWGGKSALGIDCSGLVQLACQVVGLEAPRDTDMQEARLGTRVAGVEALRRGDLVFWKGHVGIMLDGAMLLHANAYHMRTAVEPLRTAIERMEDKGSLVTTVRRIDTPA